MIRSPRRSSATVGALMVGLMFVYSTAAYIQSYKHMIDRWTHRMLNADLVVEVLGFLHELLDVGPQEVVLLGVEILQEILAPLIGDLVVDDRAGHVTAFQQVDHGARGLLVLVGGDGCLGSHYHCHEGQDRDQRQGT